MQIRSQRNGDINVHATEEADLHAERRADPNADRDVVIERVPENQEVTIRREPHEQPAWSVRRIETRPRHDARVGQRKIRFALNRDYAEERPVIAKPWNVWKL